MNIDSFSLYRALPEAILCRRPQPLLGKVMAVALPLIAIGLIPLVTLQATHVISLSCVPFSLSVSGVAVAGCLGGVVTLVARNRCTENRRCLLLQPTCQNIEANELNDRDTLVLDEAAARVLLMSSWNHDYAMYRENTQKWIVGYRLDSLQQSRLKTCMADESFMRSELEQKWLAGYRALQTSLQQLRVQEVSNVIQERPEPIQYHDLGSNVFLYQSVPPSPRSVENENLLGVDCNLPVPPLPSVPKRAWDLGCSETLTRRALDIEESQAWSVLYSYYFSPRDFCEQERSARGLLEQEEEMARTAITAAESSVQFLYYVHSRSPWVFCEEQSALICSLKEQESEERRNLLTECHRNRSVVQLYKLQQSRLKTCMADESCRRSELEQTWVAGYDALQVHLQRVHGQEVEIQKRQAAIRRYNSPERKWGSFLSQQEKLQTEAPKKTELDKNIKTAELILASDLPHLDPIPDCLRSVIGYYDRWRGKWEVLLLEKYWEETECLRAFSLVTQLPFEEGAHRQAVMDEEAAARTQLSSPPP